MTDQFGLFDQPVDVLAELGGAGWPDPQRLPFNGRKHSVGEIVLADLHQSSAPLIVTGFAALDRLIDFIADISDSCQEVRLLLGSEPYPARNAHLSMASHPFPAEVERYWAERGISLLLSGKLIKVIEYLRHGRVQARFVSGAPLHAKMYCTETAVTLGSSNFSKAGLRFQLEANARFMASEKRFAEAWQLAERYWEKGSDYNDQLIALLEKLLRFVEWPEALARACAELLEGEWARAYLEQQRLGDKLPLWPSQRQGIAQALWLLDNVGSALVADATGAGKTRMGAHLVRAALDRIWSSGRIRKGQPVLVCPPAVQEAWAREATYCSLPLASFSHGRLSHSASERQDLMIQSLRSSQILAVDEAHNFLNLNSQRTRLLLGNMADHTILFTATPINRSVTDLLRLVDMLGADNLAPSTLTMFEGLLRRRDVSHSLTRPELEALRKEIQRFTVRRTKTMLNRMVDEEPESFRDAEGRQCRYPKHESLMYELGESGADRKRATQIRELAGKLRGLAYLAKPIEMPLALKAIWTEEEYLQARLHAASKLPAYLVMATLRSSRAALLEHLKGTDWALKCTKAGEGFSKQSSGNVLQKLVDLAGKPPENRLSIPLPDWLTDSAAHRSACHQEEDIYLEIASLAIRLSEDREAAKATHLRKLLGQHELVLAFDSRPITLARIRRELEQHGVEVLLATGSDARGKARVGEAFHRTSARKHVVALCSDSMSEGVNLQRASCILHLDMPSVVRIAEQRVGRVDRMDSPHSVIEAWWPKDAEEFALRTDERFIERYETVEALLGSNLPLPTEMQGRGEQRSVSSAVDPLAVAQEVEQAGREWDGLEDAFAPVRGLVDGSQALVAPEVYEQYRRVSARVLSRVSLIKTHHREWAFFCLRGSGQGAPKWIAFSGDQEAPTAELAEVAELLRARLGSEAESGIADERAMQVLAYFLGMLQTAEKSLLPRRKQRALEEMSVVIGRYRKDASEQHDADTFEFLDRLWSVLQHPDPEMPADWNDVAERWLDLIRPAWYTLLTERRRKRPLLLADLRGYLLGGGRIDLQQLREAFAELRVGMPLDERIAACIVGVR